MMLRAFRPQDHLLFGGGGGTGGGGGGGGGGTGIFPGFGG